MYLIIFLNYFKLTIKMIFKKQLFKINLHKTRFLFKKLGVTQMLCNANKKILK